MVSTADSDSAGFGSNPDIPTTFRQKDLSSNLSWQWPLKPKHIIVMNIMCVILSIV